MLNTQDLALLTQTGPATPMGELFRRFWLTAMLPDELPDAGCPPKRLRMLSEDLVAWRNSDGSLGAMQNACPHRGASMFFGRNEENGLRCVYHGWKFDTEGACVDMPNEPAESNFKHKIKARAYPLAEWGGAIWIYMGPRHLQPELPQLEWCLLPDDHKLISKWYQSCNYAQAVEGDLDTSHVSFMHQVFALQADNPSRRASKGGVALMNYDGSPVLTVKETDYGFCYGARRNTDMDAYYWRVTQYLQPFYSMIPSPNSNRSGGCWLPIDDENCMGWRFGWDIEKPITPAQRGTVGGVPRIEPGTFNCVANASNDYTIDRQVQKTFNYSGIVNIREQDTLGTESMGAVMDRTREHLGTADSAIILFRRQLMRMAKALQQGIEPFSATHGDVFRVRAVDALDRADSLSGLLQVQEHEMLHSVKG